MFDQVTISNTNESIFTNVSIQNEKLSLIIKNESCLQLYKRFKESDCNYVLLKLNASILQYPTIDLLNRKKLKTGDHSLTGILIISGKNTKKIGK